MVSASPWISRGIVAEKKRVLPAFAGSLSMTRRMSWMKPMSSIRSASVEDERFHGPQLHEPLRHQVEEATGRRDEDVDPPPERLRLRALVHAAEDDGVLEGRVPAVCAEALRDLGGQLPRRREHEDADGAPTGPTPGCSLEAVQDRQREGGRLPGAGLGAADQVLPLEHDGDRLLLDGGRVVYCFSATARRISGRSPNDSNDNFFPTADLSASVLFS